MIFSQQEWELIELADRSMIQKQTDPPTWEIFLPIFDWWVLKEIESAGERRKVWPNT